MRLLDVLVGPERDRSEHDELPPFLPAVTSSFQPPTSPIALPPEQSNPRTHLVLPQQPNKLLFDSLDLLLLPPVPTRVRVYALDPHLKVLAHLARLLDELVKLLRRAGGGVEGLGVEGFDLVDGFAKLAEGLTDVSDLGREGKGRGRGGWDRVEDKGLRWWGGGEKRGVGGRTRINEGDRKKKRKAGTRARTVKASTQNQPLNLSIPTDEHSQPASQPISDSIRASSNLPSPYEGPSAPPSPPPSPPSSLLLSADLKDAY
jgi:hypothetical protein